MTWDASKPANNESPGAAPEQIRTNWARIESMITNDHLFNPTQPAQNTDGFHKITHFINQSGDIGSGTPAPITGTGQAYTKTITTLGNASSTAGAGEHICYQRGTDGGATQEMSTTVCPVRASVSFQGRSSNGTCTINWAYNVSSIDRTAEGQYTINFENDLPSIYYVPFITASRTTKLSSSKPNTIIGIPQGGTYTDTFKADSFKAYFSRATSREFIDPNTATAIFFGG